MKIVILYALALLFFACNSGKEDAAKQQQHNDSLRVDSTKPINSKVLQDSIKKTKLAYWKKQATLITVSLDADRADLNNAQQHHFGRMPGKKKREIEEATTLLAKDKKRFWQIRDSLKKYQN